MKVIVRVDASLRIGTGHVMRCLTLANHIVQAGHQVVFVVRDLPGNRVDLIRSQGFECQVLQCPADVATVSSSDHYTAWLGVPWDVDAQETASMMGDGVGLLVVDHYALDARWEKVLRPHVQKVMVIDDLASRTHDCDVLLDQNYYHNPAVRYAALVSEDTRLFLGFEYALLREEFAQAQAGAAAPISQHPSVLIFMGGSDPDGYTLAALHAMHLDKIDFEVTVVVGSSNQNIDAIKAYIKPFHNTVTLLVDVNNMAELMNAATLIVGAGGATNIERVFLHKPSLVFCVADNQVETTLDLEKTGCLKVLEVANIGLLGEEVRRLIRNQEALADMSNACVKVAAPPRLQELLSVILPPNPD